MCQNQRDESHVRVYGWGYLDITTGLGCIFLFLCCGWVGGVLIGLFFFVARVKPRCDVFLLNVETPFPFPYKSVDSSCPCTCSNKETTSRARPSSLISVCSLVPRQVCNWLSVPPPLISCVLLVHVPSSLRAIITRGIKVDENTPRPPWEEKEVVEEVTFGDGRKRKNKPIEIEVDLK